MKTQLNYLAIIAVTLSLCFTSCGKKEEIAIENPSKEIGFLTLKTELIKEINVNTTNKRPPTIDVILDDLTVEIYGEDVSGVLLYASSNYRDLPDTIELPSGQYYINMYSSNFRANLFTSRFDDPDYGWTGDFIIIAGANTEINASLNLLDTAVTIDFTDEVLNEFPDITVEAAVTYAQTGSTEFQSWTALQDENSAYFSMSDYVVFASGLSNIQAITTSLSIQITANTGFVTRIYNDLAPNQHYRITVSYSGDSSATLVVTLGDETIIEDEIPFPG